MAKINSNQVTFVDLTESRKLDVYINSNLPTTQIRNLNDKTYTPDWSVTNLKLSANVFLDSKELGTVNSIIWYKKIGTGAETQIGTSKSITITTNEMSSDGVSIITYICKVVYQNLKSQSQIAFTRVDTGLNGSDGDDAPAVLAQYSVDGTTGWTSTLNTATHKYVRHSYDGGKTWTVAIKMVGEDGTSVKIKGTATSATQVSGTDYYTLVYSSSSITGAELGDAYLYDGNLYVCADSRDGQDYFINVGTIQGPKGGDGLSSYVFIRYATDANGTDMSTSPSGKTYMGVYTSNTNTPPTTANVYTWSKFVGDNANSIVFSGDSQVFKISNDNIVTPSVIKVTAQAFNTTATNWTYSINGGQTFLSTVPTGVSRNGNIVTVTGSSIPSNSLVIKASDGQVEDVFTIYKAFDGTHGEPGNPGAPAPIAFLTNENITFSANAQGQIAGTTITSNVVAYKGTTKVPPTIGTITGTPTGMTITASAIAASNEIMLTITISNNATLGSASSNMGVINIPITSPVSTVLSLTWSKVNTGVAGVGIKSTTVAYGVSDSASTQPTDNAWQSTVPAVAEGKYLWTRTIIDYTDDAVADTVTYTYVKQGAKVEQGNPGTPVAVSSIQYQEGTSATVSPTGTWSNSVVAVAEGKFLWTKTAFSDGKIAYGVARQGMDGGDGRGVSSIVEQYYQSTSATAQSGGSWSTTVPTWVDGKYIWTRSIITYTDSTTHTTSPICVTGQKGGIGGTGIGVSSVDVWYYQSTSATALSGGSWSTTAPTWSDGQYVWTKTITTYTNNTTDETNAVCMTGQKGSTGVGVKSITEYYLATSSSSGVTISTSGWTTTVQTITFDKKYLWNYEIITYTNDTTSTTAPVIIGVFGNTGNTGKGIKSVTEYYLATASSSNVTTATSGWTPTMQTLTSAKKYLWNYELITYTDNTTATINPVIIGVYGDQGVAAVSFQVYAPSGFLLTKELESLTLQTFAYEGSTAITSGATYQWSQLIDDTWTTISDATDTTYTVTHADVLKAKSYRCVMTYKSQDYTSTVTVQDKTDTYNAIMSISSNAANNDCYWVLHTIVYSDTEEVDPLLGPIAISAPTSPVKGDYWYSVDTANTTVTLKTYDGTSWVNSTDAQSLSYSWNIINDGSSKIPLGASAKVKVISCHDFTATATVMCEVSSPTDGVLTQSSLSLTDASDPIVSDTEPTATVDGQIWIKRNENGTYLMFVWDKEAQSWTSSDMDSRSKVYTSKPSSYNAGDLWITASDGEYGGYYALATTYAPNIKYYVLTGGSYVLASPQPTNATEVLAQSYYRYITYLQGTLLQAKKHNATYNAADWSPTLRYDSDVDGLKDKFEQLSHYVSITTAGLRMAAVNENDELSPFTALFTSTDLSFYQNSEKLLILANNQLTAPRVVVEDDLEVQGSISLGSLKMIIESNGSFSFAVKT